MARPVTIKTVSTNQRNVSKRTVSYDIYLDGKIQVGNIANVLDAIDLKIHYERMEDIADRN